MALVPMNDQIECWGRRKKVKMLWTIYVMGVPVVPVLGVDPATRGWVSYRVVRSWMLTGLTPQ